MSDREFPIKIKDMSKDELVKALEDILEKLDILDQEDFFGTEGWQHFFAGGLGS